MISEPKFNQWKFESENGELHNALQEMNKLHSGTKTRTHVILFFESSADGKRAKTDSEDPGKNEYTTRINVHVKAWKNRLQSQIKCNSRKL